MRARRGLRYAQYLFTITAVVALGYCLTVWVGAKLYQAREEQRFDNALRPGAIRLAPGAIPRAVAAVRNGSPVGRLDIPRLAVSAMVLEGVGSGDLERAVGHIPGTALPGEGGNVGIAGHRDTFFRALRSIHRDDTITLTTLEGIYHYRVVSTKVVAPEDVQVLNPTGRDTLTLVTCFPFYYVGPAPRRFIVRADLSSATTTG